MTELNVDEWAMTETPLGVTKVKRKGIAHFF